MESDSERIARLERRVSALTEALEHVLRLALSGTGWFLGKEIVGVDAQDAVQEARALAREGGNRDGT